jgi:hypothetical protein
VPEPRLQGVLTEEERMGRWEVRAAHWRALELANAAFGGPVRSSLLGLRHRGPMRGLLRLDVPWEGLELHREREAVFLSMAGADPLLSRVPLVYVLGPDAS